MFTYQSDYDAVEKYAIMIDTHAVLLIHLFNKSFKSNDYNDSNHI